MKSNKSVIIIGNCPSILLRKNGEKIDSYDIVIRINHCVTDGYEKFIGKKINIWATTKVNLTKGNFIPKDYHNLLHVWHRTGRTKNISRLPKTLGSDYIMYKTDDFKKSFGHLINKDTENKWNLKDTNQEFCTGLLTILTSTLFYEDITITGFNFYEEQEGNRFLEYYQKDQLDKNGKHYEDKHIEEDKKSGFISSDMRNKKKKIIEDMESQGLIKILR